MLSYRCSSNKLPTVSPNKLECLEHIYNFSIVVYLSQESYKLMRSQEVGQCLCQIHKY